MSQGPSKHPSTTGGSSSGGGSGGGSSGGGNLGSSPFGFGSSIGSFTIPKRQRMETSDYAARQSQPQVTGQRHSTSSSFSSTTRDASHSQHPPPASATQTLFQDLMVNESAFQNEVLPPLLDNFLLPSLRSSVRLSNARRVHNIQLGEAFIRRQTQLRRRGFPSEVSYAFFLLDGSDPDEEERLCEEGLRSGHSVLSHLGPSDQGVTLSLHPDTCTPAPLFDRVKMRVLVLKVLKGRSRVVAPMEAVPQRPDPAFTSHIYSSARNDLSIIGGDSNSQTRFRHSQIYLYEHAEKGGLVIGPHQALSGIFPWATVSVSFGSSSGLLTHYLLSMNEREALVWTGAMKIGESTVDNVELLAPIKGAVKPPGFASTIEIDSLVSWNDCLRFAPILQLTPFATIMSINGSQKGMNSDATTLVDKLHLTLTVIDRHFSKHSATRLTISYFTLHQPNSPLFRRLHNTLRRGKWAGLTLLPNGSDVLLVVPNGELSALLSLPSYDFPAFHCLFVRYEVETSVMEYSVADAAASVGGVEKLAHRPSATERLDGDNAAILSALTKFHTERGTVFPQAVNIPPPTLLMSVPPPRLMVPPPPGGLFIPPPPPPVQVQPPTTSKMVDEEARSKQAAKIKSLIQSTLENVRNVAISGNGGGGAQRQAFDEPFSAAGATTDAKSAPTAVRDPRLARQRMMAAPGKGAAQLGASIPPLPSMTTLFTHSPATPSSKASVGPLGDEQREGSSPVPMEIDGEGEDGDEGKAEIKLAAKEPAATKASKSSSPKPVPVPVPRPYDLKKIITGAVSSDQGPSKSRRHDSFDDTLPSPGRLRIADESISTDSVEVAVPSKGQIKDPRLLKSRRTSTGSVGSATDEGGLASPFGMAVEGNSPLERGPKLIPLEPTMVAEVADMDEGEEDGGEEGVEADNGEDDSNDVDLRPTLPPPVQSPANLPLAPNFSIPPPPILPTLHKPIGEVKPIIGLPPMGGMSLSGQLRFPVPPPKIADFSRIPPPIAKTTSASGLGQASMPLCHYNTSQPPPPTPKPSTSPFVPAAMHPPPRFDVPPPPLVQKAPSIPSLMSVVIQPPPVSSSTTSHSTHPTPQTSLIGGERMAGVGLEMVRRCSTLVVVPDPELLLSSAISTSDFNNLLESAEGWRMAQGRHRQLSFKWHSSTTKALHAQKKCIATNTPAAVEKCKQMIALIEKHTSAAGGSASTGGAQPLMDCMPDHLCDVPPRNINKLMICCMNAQRNALNAAVTGPAGKTGQAEAVKVIFLSAEITASSSAASNFTNNGILVLSPAQFLHALEGVKPMKSSPKKSTLAAENRNGGGNSQGPSDDEGQDEYEELSSDEETEQDEEGDEE